MHLLLRNSKRQNEKAHFKQSHVRGKREGKISNTGQGLRVSLFLERLTSTDIVYLRFIHEGSIYWGCCASFCTARALWAMLQAKRPGWMHCLRAILATVWVVSVMSKCSSYSLCQPSILHNCWLWKHNQHTVGICPCNKLKLSFFF